MAATQPMLLRPITESRLKRGLKAHLQKEDLRPADKSTPARIIGSTMNSHRWNSVQGLPINYTLHTATETNDISKDCSFHERQYDALCSLPDSHPILKQQSSLVHLSSTSSPSPAFVVVVVAAAAPDVLSTIGPHVMR